MQLSERNRQLDRANEFVNLRNAQGDNKQAQEHLARLVSRSK
jgi:hypothetical protein